MRTHVARATSVALTVAALALTAATAALAGPAARGAAEPVGPLPKHPVFYVKVLRGATFLVRAPKRPANSGLVWRVARQFDGKVVQQVGEGEDRLTVWLRFKAVRAGTTRVVLALTKGETRKASAARTWVVTARGVTVTS